MKWLRSHEPTEAMSEVNLTPLIDVSLVLVVILLLTSPLAFESSLGLKDTDRDAAPPTADAAGETIEIVILNNHEVRVGALVATIADLEGILPSVIAGSKTGEIVVRCADQVNHGTFVGVLDTAMLSGAKGIAVTEI